MIPEDAHELDLMAGEYVLGVLDRDTAREVEAARATNPALSRAISFWETQLHPLTALASPAEPPAGGWQRIAERLWPERSGWRNSLALWRSVALATSAVAAALLVYIVLAPPTAGPNLVAFLHVPSDTTPVWLVTAGPDSLTLQAVGDHPTPSGRDLELWTIPAGGGRPEPLGVIPASGRLVVPGPPAAVTAGATLAISVEPKGGSPTGQPTGPVAFSGTIIRAL
jgi:anti-sigma-K factor RskA